GPSFRMGTPTSKNALFSILLSCCRVGPRVVTGIPSLEGRAQPLQGPRLALAHPLGRFPELRGHLGGGEPLEVAEAEQLAIGRGETVQRGAHAHALLGGHQLVERVRRSL